MTFKTFRKIHERKVKTFLKKNNKINKRLIIIEKETKGPFFHDMTV